MSESAYWFFRWYRSTFGYALAGAVVLWAALPPLDFGVLGFVGPVWWVLLIRRKELAGRLANDNDTRDSGGKKFSAVFRRISRRPYLGLWTVGFLFWLAVLHWLRLPHPATAIGWVALSFYFAFYLPVFVGLARVAVHRLHVPVIVAAPVVWTGLELARAWLLTGMTMASLGHSQHAWITFIQVADLAGAIGVGFVVMFVAACIARMLPVDDQRWTFWPLLAAVALLAVTLAYGTWRTSGDHTEPGLRVALIQGSIDSKLKSEPGSRDRVHQQYIGLTEEALRLGRESGRPVDLIIWPETMWRDPWYTFDADAHKPDVYKDWTQQQFLTALKYQAPESHRELSELVRRWGVPAIIGVDRQHFGRDRMRFYNTAALFSADGQIVDHYGKRHLVMFGEYVPFAQYVPAIQRLTPLPISLDAGEHPATFAVGRLRFAPNICFESVLSRVIRGQVNDLRAKEQEPDVLVNLTNDGWFWGSSELDLHLACGVFRAVECRKPLLVAANTGFSAWIDGDGRVVARGPRRDTGVVLADVERDDRRSWYLRYGDLPAGLCLLACGVFAAVGLRKAEG